MNKIIGICCLGLLGLSINCSSDPSSPSPPPPQTQDPSVSNLAPSDINNKNNGLDLNFGFTKSPSEENVSEYRIMVVNFDQSSSFDLAAAVAVTPDNYVTALPNGSNHIIEFEADAKTVSGDLIQEDISYRFYVLIKDADATNPSYFLSLPSAPFTLLNVGVVSTLLTMNEGTGDLEVDSQGNIYHANGGSAQVLNGNSVIKITPDGQRSTFAIGQGISGALGNAFDSEENLFQSNFAANTISKITPDGQVTTFVSTGLSGPTGIHIDENNTLFVCSYNDNKLVRIDQDGNVVVWAISNLLNGPNGITYADGNFYVVNFNDGAVMKATPTGDISLFVQLPGGNTSQIRYENNLLYTVARGANAIYTIDLEANFEIYAGNLTRGHTNGPVLQASFSLPNAIAFSPDKSIIYINEVTPTTGGNAFAPTTLRKIIVARDN